MNLGLFSLATFWAFFLQLSRWALVIVPQFAGLGAARVKGVDFRFQPFFRFFFSILDFRCLKPIYHCVTGDGNDATGDH